VIEFGTVRGVHRIVLVDDSAELRALVRTRLRLCKAFEVVGEGSNGLDAIALAAEHQPDIVMLDVSMPGMDGLEAIPLVITAAPKTTVVMFSGFDEQGLADRALAMGANDFIEKSIAMSELPDRLLAAVGAAPSEPSQDREDGRETSVMTEQVERFRAAFEEAAIGMATMTLTGRIVRANRAMDRLVGVASGTLVGKVFADLADPETVNLLNGVILRVASGAVDADSTTHELLTAAHDEVWATSTVAVVRDSAGKPLYLFLQVQDITERRAAEEELRRSEERFRLLVESVGDYAIFMLDPTGHISSWNRGAQRIKGWTEEEVLGKHFGIFYDEAGRASNHPQEELDLAIAEGRFEEEGWRVRKDGSRFWANVVLTPIRDGNGELRGFAKVTRDITDRLRLTEERDRAQRELERAAKERTESLAVTAHELRGPVSLLHGFSELLRDHWPELDDAERDDMITTISRASGRLRRLVEDLLTASRIESGAVTIELERVQLAPILRNVAAELSPGEDEQIDVRCPDDLFVVADPGRLQQVLGNYLTNALRYGAPPIGVTAASHGPTVEIAVTDAGSGVAEPLRTNLFDKFTHGEHEDSTGLGLYIVRQLALAQGGDARYEVPPDGGSRFILELAAGA
jgi:PAS domain S-box-containing protein